MSDLPVEVMAQEHSLQNITFEVGDELFGVNIMYVEEIITPREVTAIPKTPDYFLGIINLRGEVISIIDMRIRFGIEKLEITPDSRVVVIMIQGLKLGMLVDKISSIVTLDKKDISDSSTLAAQKRNKYISGSYKLPNERILLLLMQDRIINEEDFHIHQEIQESQEVVQVDAQQEEQNVVEINIIGFSLGCEMYTIESLQVEEIILLPEVTIIPEMENFMEGIFHLRNDVIPLVHLSDKLGLKRTELHEESPVIIMKIYGIKVGLIVDRITEVFLIKEDEILPPPINLSKRQIEQIKGVIKLERGEKTIIAMLLKPDQLFSDSEREALLDFDARNESKELVETEREEEVPILEFMLAGERYAIPVSEANEIIPVREIVPVPKSPPYIKGVVNLRGDVISIVDLPLLVDHLDYQFTDDTKLLIVDPGTEVAGLIVEKMIGIRKVALSTFEKPSELVRQRGNVFIQGIGKVEKTGEIVVLMDIRTTLQQAQSDETYDDLEDVKGELLQLEQEDKDERLLLEEPT